MQVPISLRRCLCRRFSRLSPAPFIGVFAGSCRAGERCSISYATEFSLRDIPLRFSLSPKNADTSGTSTRRFRCFRSRARRCRFCFFLRPVLCRFFGECQSFKNRCLQRRFRAAFGQIRRVGRKLSVRLHRILRGKKYHRRRKRIFTPQNNSAISCGCRLIGADTARIVLSRGSPALFKRYAEVHCRFPHGKF